MKIFKRKKDSAQHEILQQFGVGSYFEIPEDFDCDAWLTATNQYIFQTSYRQKALYFIAHMFDTIKSKLFGFGKTDFDQSYSDGEFDDTEFNQTLERGFEIVEEIQPQVQSFAEQLIDTDRAEIKYRNKRIVYYRKDHPTNPGYARYVEDLDGSNRFEYGWVGESGTRKEIFDSILYHLGYECAQIEMGTLWVWIALTYFEVKPVDNPIHEVGGQS